jgi:hypothetical protein
MPPQVSARCNPPEHVLDALILACIVLLTDSEDALVEHPAVSIDPPDRRKGGLDFVVGRVRNGGGDEWVGHFEKAACAERCLSLRNGSNRAVDGMADQQFAVVRDGRFRKDRSRNRAAT